MQVLEATALDATRSEALRDVWGQTLCELGENDERLVVLDGDLANSTKADTFASCYPDRFYEMGIAEQNLVGVAAGMAATGLVPWVSTFAAFLAKRALDQIRVVIAQPHLNVKLCGGYTGILTGKTGKTHQSVEDIAVFRAMPDMVTIAPADGNELRSAMAAMQDDDRPTYLRLTRDPNPTIFPDSHEFVIGGSVLLRTGTDIGLISTGLQTTRALAAADLLEEQGISAAVLHIPTLKPFDRDAVCEVAARVRGIVTAEDHSIIGGLGGAVAEVLADCHPTRMRRIGIPDTFGESGPNDALLEKYGLTPRHIAEKALELSKVVS
jgi:transketolase